MMCLGPPTSSSGNILFLELPPLFDAFVTPGIPAAAMVLNTFCGIYGLSVCGVCQSSPEGSLFQQLNFFWHIIWQFWLEGCCDLPGSPEGSLIPDTTVSFLPLPSGFLNFKSQGDKNPKFPLEDNAVLS